MSPAALLGSPDRIIGLQDALRGSCLLVFQLFTFLIKKALTYSLSRDVRFIQVVGSSILMGWLLE